MDKNAFTIPAKYGIMNEIYDFVEITKSRITGGILMKKLFLLLTVATMLTVCGCGGKDAKEEAAKRV